MELQLIEGSNHQYSSLYWKQKVYDLTIGFKSTHISEILSNLTSESIIMKFADKRRSALILPDGDDASAQKVFGIVMPIMVR